MCAINDECEFLEWFVSVWLIAYLTENHDPDGINSHSGFSKLWELKGSCFIFIRLLNWKQKDGGSVAALGLLLLVSVRIYVQNKQFVAKA